MKCFIIIFLLIASFSCKKDNPISPQTISLIQNKWTLVSEEYYYKNLPSYNVKYVGISTDYYFFKTNDSLLMHQAGMPGLLNIPFTFSIPYKIISNNSILLPGQNGGNDTYFTIQKLTTDSLIFTNQITNTFTNNGNTTGTYYGIRTVILAK